MARFVARFLINREKMVTNVHKPRLVLRRDARLIHCDSGTGAVIFPTLSQAFSDPIYVCIVLDKALGDRLNQLY